MNTTSIVSARKSRKPLLIAAALLVAASACQNDTPPAATAAPAPAKAVAPLEGKQPALSNTAAAEKAQVGKPAPDFTLQDLEGKSLSLSQFKGKTVVLEWFNPECPFVKGSHNVGSLKGLASKLSGPDVVWLAINSGGPGKQGNSADANRQAIKTFELNHPVLLDASGKVGRQYGAERTPHMFVINAAGTLVYRGAIDNSPDAEGKSPQGGVLVNYVERAIEALRQGKAVETAETAPYGCSVKYSEES